MPQDQWTCYVSLGSNLGHRLENIVQSILRIHFASGIFDLKSSHIYLTASLSPTSQNDFYNCICEFKTKLPVLDLVESLRFIELSLGKVTKKKTAPRVIDIDFIAYGNLIYESKDLIIPHPKWSKRAFVLYPLAELTSVLAGHSIEYLLQQLPKKQTVEKLNYHPPYWNILGSHQCIR